MPQPSLSDELLRERARQYNQMGGNAALLARSLGMSPSTIKSQIEIGRVRFPELFDYEANQKRKYMLPWTLPQMLLHEVNDGCVIVGGDLHLWPGEVPLMWQAFCAVAHKLRPQAIVLNGDMIDGARVSRHGSVLGAGAPKIDEEIDALSDAMRMLPHATHQIWPIGNHDQRVNNYLANAAPELEHGRDALSRHRADLLEDSGCGLSRGDDRREHLRADFVLQLRAAFDGDGRHVDDLERAGCRVK